MALIVNGKQVSRQGFQEDVVLIPTGDGCSVPAFGLNGPEDDDEDEEEPDGDDEEQDEGE